MKKGLLVSFLFLCSCLQLSAQNVPELMYYKFDAAGSQVNSASAPVGTNPSAITGLTIGTPGQFGNGLVGTGAASSTNNVNTGWATNLTGSWTISMWLNIPSSTATRYFFGDLNAGSLRCFSGGVATNDGLRLTGSITFDLLNIGIASGPFVVHYVYNSATGMLSGYINGVFKSSASFPSLSITGAGPFYVGGYSTTNGSVEGSMDEFRMYNRALDAAEVAATWNITLPGGPCTTPPNPGTATSSGTPVCFGQAVSLNLSGNSFGLGQTYQWQSSSTQNGTYTNIGSSGSSTTLSINPTSTLWYRCIVTCNSQNAFSTPVEVVVNSLFPAGTYSINSSISTGGTNFQNFADALTAIKCGIAGPVVFNVAPGSGPYAEQVTIPQIGGASATNTVTFNGNGATLNYSAPDAANRTAIILNGADHIIIDSLIIDVSTGAANGWGIGLTNRADSNTIRKCTILNNTAATTTNYAGIVINGSLTGTASSGNNGNYNTFDRNTITGGYYGVYIYGSSVAGALNLGNVVSNNTIQGFYAYGINGLYQNGMVLSKNDISRPSRTTTLSGASGIFISTGCISSLVEKNRVYNLFGGLPTSTSALYGIYINGDGTVADPNRIVNNVVYEMVSSGIQYGIYNLGAAYMQAYHNTISLDDQAATAGNTAGFFQTTSDVGIEFRNNIVSVTRSGSGYKYAIYKATATTPLVSNNNVLYVNSAGSGVQGVGFQTSAQTTLSNWQTASGQDGASRAVDPLFVNASGGDFTPSEPSINDIGDNLGITSDILGKPRGTSPDPGAFEFSLSGCTNPPVPGFAIASGTTVCPGENFTLNLSGNSVGAGQTYQWQLSPTGSAPWSNVGVPETNPLINATQPVSYYYRAEVKCNTGIPVYSPSVQVLSPVLVSGTFTINSALPNGSGNFQTFGDAVNSIKCGINGPVVFNVAPGSGPYVEQVVIPQVNGTSATNTITFNGNGATLVHSPTDGLLRTAIIFNGADHIIIDSLVVDVSAGTFGWGIGFTAQADSNTIRKCTINVQNVASTLTNFAGIVFNGSLTGTAVSGNNGNGNKIMNNTIAGGYYGVYLYGNSASAVQNNNNYISGNIITDFYNYGVYSIYQSSGLVIRKNDFSRPTRTNSTTTGGVFNTTGSIGVLIEKNKVHNLFDAFTTGASTTYGIYVGSAGTIAAPNKVENNLVYNLGGNGPAYGLYNATSPYMQAYHNTISMDGQSATTGLAYGFYQTGTALGIDFRNNIVNVTRTGTGAKRCVFLNTTTSTVISNRNVLYMNSPAGTNNHVGQYGTTGTFNFTTLADWQTANSNAFDQQSVGVDPIFFNPSGGDYTPNTSLVNNIGVGVGVSTDIKDFARSGTDPDPGAYEFSTLTAGINMSAEGVTSPVSSATGCYTATETITIRIRNNSTSTIDFAVNPVTVTVNVTGAGTQTLMTTLTGGTLASDATMFVTMPVTLNMSTAGVYTFNANTSVTGDVNPANDALIPVNRTKVALDPGTIMASPGTYCALGGTLPTLSNSGSTGLSGLQWQQSTASGSGFSNISGGTTSPFATSAPITQNMYYRLIATCGSSSITSPEAIVNYSNPQVSSTSPGYTCGPGTVTLGATGSAGTLINWFNSTSSTTPLATGSSYTTPVISATTTYYVSAKTAGGGSGTTPLPAQTSTQSGNVRGYWFTAPVSFNITGVLDLGTGAGPQNISVIRFNPSVTPPTFGATTNDFSVLYLTQNNATTGVIPVNIPINAGDVIGVFGQRGTGTTAVTSYGSPNPYSTTIAGQSVALNRMGMQFPLTTTSPQDVWQEPTSTFIGRIELTYETGCESARVPVVATVDNDPGCVPFPVTLLSFKGERKGAVNSLQWITTTEINNSGFELQRSADGNNFSKLVFVSSKANGGNSTNNLTYNFDDIKPLFGNGYYRLKQIDKDGKFNFSPIVLIKGAKSNAITLNAVYPNPAYKDLNLLISAPASEKLNLVVTDITGRVMMQKSVQTISGDNIFNLQVDRLSSGTYFIKAVCANGCETAVQKFVKQ